MSIFPIFEHEIFYIYRVELGSVPEGQQSHKLNSHRQQNCPSNPPERWIPSVLFVSSVKSISCYLHKLSYEKEIYDSQSQRGTLW